MKLNSNSIITIVVVLLMVTVLFSMLPSILPTVITSVNNLFGSTALGNATLVGAGPSAFATTVTTLTGWFWVIGPFLLTVSIIVGLFIAGKHR